MTPEQLKQKHLEWLPDFMREDYESFDEHKKALADEILSKPVFDVDRYSREFA